MPSRLFEQISSFYDQPEIVLHSSFSDLSNADFDLGYRTLNQNGEEIHAINRNIALSVQHVKNGKYENILFTNSMPLLLELADSKFRMFKNDFIEIRYLFSGQITVEFEDRTTVLHEDDICLISAGTMHHDLVKDVECMFLNIDIDKDIFNESMLQSIALNPLQKFLRNIIISKANEQPYLLFKPVTSRADSDINHYLRNIFREAKDQRAGYLDIAKGYLIRLMDELASDYHSNFTDDEKNQYRDKLFQSVSVFMSEHISTVKIEDLCNEFHYGPNFFNLLIKEKSGMTYSEYLINLRINRAKLLLENTDMAIEQIAFLVGYHNKGFFYSKFQKNTGMNPAEYRRHYVH